MKYILVRFEFVVRQYMKFFFDDKFILRLGYFNGLLSWQYLLSICIECGQLMPCYVVLLI